MGWMGYGGDGLDILPNTDNRWILIVTMVNNGIPDKQKNRKVGQKID